MPVPILQAYRKLGDLALVAKARAGDQPALHVLVERHTPRVNRIASQLMGNVEDPTVLWAWVVRHLERLIEELRFHHVRTDALAVQVAWKDGESTGGVCRLACASDRFDELLDAARVALRRAYVPSGTATFEVHVTTHQQSRSRSSSGAGSPLWLTLTSRPTFSSRFTIRASQSSATEKSVRTAGLGGTSRM